MCGIIGYFGSYTENSLKAGLNSIAHRGPDNQSIYIEPQKQIGLGHARLSIIDTSPLGNQPMVSDDKSTVLVFNGEIYNFKELRSQILNFGETFKSSSDTEVLLKLFERFGTSAFKMLNGIFSLAIWNRSWRRCKIKFLSPRTCSNNDRFTRKERKSQESQVRKGS